MLYKSTKSTLLWVASRRKFIGLPMDDNANMDVKAHPMNCVCWYFQWTKSKSVIWRNAREIKRNSSIVFPYATFFDGFLIEAILLEEI